MIGLLLGEILLSGLIVSGELIIQNINYIDTDLPKYSSIVAPTDSSLGTGSKLGVTQIIKNPSGSSKPSSYTQRILYKYPKAISAPIDVYGDYYLGFDAGSSVQLSYSQSKGNSQTYSLQVSTSVSKSLQSDVKLGTGIGVVKAEASASSSLGFTTSITGTIEDSYSYTESFGETITYYINETGTYRLETRGLFEVYIVEYITGVYDVKKVGNKYVPTSTKAYYTIETSYILSYIEGTKLFGLFKYNEINGTGKFELDKSFARRIYGSSSLSFID